ncbi:MAG: response regulator, partial [bacterium]|nr:response regulator [bacterium]
MAYTILIVEDEETVIESITMALETEGFAAAFSLTGYGALEILAEKDIALIILDVGLPDISGFDLCREIRKKSDVPIIFLTARTEDYDRIVGLEIGGDHYMTKPFNPRELTAQVRAVLRRTKGEWAPATEPAGGAALFTINEECKKITYCNSRLELTAAEFILLLAFITHPQRVYTPDDLIDLLLEEL